MVPSKFSYIKIIFKALFSRDEQPIGPLEPSAPHSYCSEPPKTCESSFDGGEFRGKWVTLTVAEV